MHNANNRHISGIHLPLVSAVVIVVHCLGLCQPVNCDIFPWGSVGALGCDWEQQVSSLDNDQLTWTLPNAQPQGREGQGP